jgi:hypothetical protein
MNATTATARVVGVVLTLTIIELTLATAYIHLTYGGLIFTLNGIGYVVLAAAYAASGLPMSFVQRFAWLPRLGLAGYALVTIGAYLVIGPYSYLGWIAKGIEVAIIGLVVAHLVNTYGSAERLARVRVAPAERSSGQPSPG